MSEYIDREAALKALCIECGDSCKKTGYDCCTEYERIKEIPAADVAEVVRCKDCMYFGDKVGGAYGYCYHGSAIEGPLAGDYYCYFGERDCEVI